MENTVSPMKEGTVKAMFEAGAQFGFTRSRRHPSTSSYIFGVKNRVEIIDLEQSARLLTKACEFVKSLGTKREQILFVGNKVEARGIVTAIANKLNLPYVSERWLGGTLTNWPEIKKRIARLTDLTEKREHGELHMYTKKERLLIDREIAKLNRFFAGLLSMPKMPGALFVVDPREEKTAVREAQALNIPVVALCGTDCDIRPIAYPIVANDASRTSISHVLDQIVAAYEEGLKLPAEGAAGIVTPVGVDTLGTKTPAEGAEFSV